MSGDGPHEDRPLFSEHDSSSCRIETQGGTVYWLSRADDDGLRWVVREHLQSSDTNTMVMHRGSGGEKGSEVDLGDKFKGWIRSDVQIGSPFVIEVSDNVSRIMSEPVVDIEIGKVPEMLFG